MYFSVSLFLPPRINYVTAAHVAALRTLETSVFIDLFVFLLPYLCVFFSKRRRSIRRGRRKQQRTTIKDQENLYVFLCILYFSQIFLCISCFVFLNIFHKYTKRCLSLARSGIRCGRARQGCALNKRGGGRLPMGVYKPPTSLLGPG